MIVRTMGNRDGKCDACNGLIAAGSGYYWDAHWQVACCRPKCVRFAIAKAAADKLHAAARAHKPVRPVRRIDPRMPRLVLRRHGTVCGKHVDCS